MSGHTHTPAFTLIFTDLNASGISQQLTQGHLSSETTPDAYSEGACERDNRGEQAFLQAIYLLGHMLKATCQLTMMVTSDR